MKAVKNHAEIAGSRAAHKRDGAALARFLAWFEREAPSGKLTRDRRGGGAGKLPPRHRPAQGHFLPDHRRRRAERGDRALPRHREHQPAHRHERIVPDRFRRAIRGRHHRHHPHARRRHADARKCATASRACSRATSPSPPRCFRRAPSGAQLDPLARVSLWQAGLDFDHGTGHGVGSYLSVHEGPARISKLGTVGAAARHDPVERAGLLQDRRPTASAPRTWCW